jgi:hypothetical protein
MQQKVAEEVEEVQRVVEVEAEAPEQKLMTRGEMEDSMMHEQVEDLAQPSLQLQ